MTKYSVHEFTPNAAVATPMTGCWDKEVDYG